MIDPALKPFANEVRHSKVAVKEKGKQAIFVNEERKLFYIIRVDGNLIKNEISSDYVVRKAEVGNVIIELKGMDVDHAVEQILATARYWKKNGYKNSPVAGLVVCSRKPSFDTKVQRHRSKFAKEFNGPLHVVSHNDEFVFERVLAQGGPK